MKDRKLFHLVNTISNIFTPCVKQRLWSGIPRNVLILVSISRFLARLFSEKIRRYCYNLGVVVVIVMVQKLTFCNISVVIIDIYMKLGVCVHYAEVSILLRETIQNAFFLLLNYAPFSTFYPLSNTAELYHLHTVLLF